MKRGQFFILTAVIISAIIVGSALTYNYVIISELPKNFFDFSYNIQTEAGGVLNYQIYQDIPENTNLSDFVKKIAQEIINTDPDTNFIVIYTINQTNFGTIEYLDTSTEFILTSLKIGNTNIEMGETKSKKIDLKVKNIPSRGDKLEINFSGDTQTIDLTSQKKVILILQKKIGDETIVDIQK